MKGPLKFRNTSFPPTLTAIAQMENVAGYKLPDDIRLHFLQHGGGEASRNALTISGAPVDEDEPFLRLGFPSLFPSLLFRHNTTQQLLIRVAVDGQESFCYILGGEDQGAILHCHGRPLADSQVTRVVAPTLHDFFELLESDPVDPWEDQMGYDDRFWAGKTYQNYEPFLPSPERLRALRGANASQSVSFANCHPPVTDEHFEWMEQGFQMRIPLEIREHYQKHNGGTPDKPHFLHNGRACSVFRFFNMQYPVPLGASGQMMTELGYLEDRAMEWKWRTQFLPAYLWPLATVERFGDCLCFSSREQDFGSIQMFATEVGVYPPVTKVANTFNEFLDMLVGEPPEETWES